MIKFLKDSWAAFRAPEQPAFVISVEHSEFLASKISFYQELNERDRQIFEENCVEFINATDFIGHQTEITDEDKILVACGSVILAWGFDKWAYVRVDTVYLIAEYIELEEAEKDDGSVIHGMVGNNHLEGKMILSKPALHYGFNNSRDKHNVAIHEFSHLIDMADQVADGLPEQLVGKEYAIPWLSLVEKEIQKIIEGDSNIRDYGATNQAEFLAVATEYFFERPKMLKQKHPEVYGFLEQFYRQNRAD